MSSPLYCLICNINKPMPGDVICDECERNEGLESLYRLWRAESEEE